LVETEAPLIASLAIFIVAHYVLCHEFRD